MDFLSLTLRNLGVFRGEHHFDLATLPSLTNTTANPRRNLTIISGHNGSGKSTLFQALSLALHGPLALGDRVSRQTYNDVLLNRLHRITDGDGPTVCDEGSVELSFRYVQSGQPHQICVNRSWERKDRNVVETLTVLRDGQPPDVNPSDYQIWLNDLIPPGLASVCFFDAERLDVFASPEYHDEILGETLRRLFGLDLTERLQADLEQYTIRRGGGRKVERLRDEVLASQADLDALEVQLDQLQVEAKTLDDAQDGLEADLAKQEGRLAAEGGSYAARRPILQKRLTAIQGEIETTTQQLGELCADLLPFALVPELCQGLSHRIAQEAERHRHQVADELWQKRITQVKASLKAKRIWQGVDVSPADRQLIVQRFIDTLKNASTSHDNAEQPFIHRLAEPDQERLQGWIATALHAIPPQTHTMGKHLQDLQAERQHIEEELRRVPGDDILAPIYEEIARLQTVLSDLRQRKAALDKQIGSLQYQYDEQSRQLQRLADQLADAQRDEQQLQRAQQSKLALRVYQDALIRQRLLRLEQTLLSVFNTICQKEYLLSAVNINPETFHLQLQGKNGHPFSLEDFSAGERQLYALALLWALRQVSGRQLPLVVDTPLARLDEAHRWRLFRDYLPGVSNQVILLTTDAELDTALWAQVEPHLKHVYRLDYDPQHEETIVTYEERPEVQGVVLYQSDRMNGACGEDLQVWLTNPERIYTNGEAKWALLPTGAKRLVLVDPDTHTYNWEHIAELERLIKKPSLSKQLRHHAQLSDLWDDEWFKCLQRAGYDSVTTLGAEGPEEYILNPAKLVPLNNHQSATKRAVS